MEIVRITHDTIAVRAFAKINLYLSINGLLPNGYHTLDMVMQEVSVFDVVTVSKAASGITLSCNDRRIPTNERNIAIKAAKRFIEVTKLSGAFVHIDIQKNIPQKAGMAGGSADGAGVLFCLNKLFKTNLSMKTLCEIGKEVGADIPFCLTGGTALVGGIGDVITRLNKLNRTYLVIVRPPVGINTKLAYDRYDSLHQSGGIVNASGQDVSRMVQAIDSGNITAVAGQLYNVFEEVADDPDIQNAKRLMIQHNALGALMTGSGSAVFGIFSDEAQARACYGKVRQRYEIAFLAHTR